MVITEINKIGKGMRYKVYAGDELIGVFEAEILARYQIRSGQEYSEEFIEEMRVVNGDYACFDMALNALTHGMKTEKVLKDNLKKKGYPMSSIEKAITKVKEYGYLDDREYASTFIKTYAHMKGKRKLKCELVLKGVPMDVVDEALAELDDDEQLLSCKMLAEKYMGTRDFNDKTLQKLYHHLLGKGFDYSMVARAVSEVKNGRD